MQLLLQRDPRSDAWPGLDWFGRHVEVDEVVFRRDSEEHFSVTVLLRRRGADALYHWQFGPLPVAPAEESNWFERLESEFYELSDQFDSGQVDAGTAESVHRLM